MKNKSCDDYKYTTKEYKLDTGVTVRAHHPILTPEEDARRKRVMDEAATKLWRAAQKVPPSKYKNRTSFLSE